MADPAFAEIDTLCAATVEYNASDLLMHEGRPPQLRIDGKLVQLESPPLSHKFFDALWAYCGAKKTDLDFDTSLTSSEGTRFRVNLLHQLGQRAAVLRRIRSVIPTMDDLGLPSFLLQEWMARKTGVILVCGPTGSGKSTTLAAAIDWMNGQYSRHVVTIEDPIEFLFQGKVSLFTQREVGIDTSTFAEGLRRSLRQNPDVILVGEIRDSVTASTAIQASETGHLVLATLHSATCHEAIDRLQLLFPPVERDSVRKTLASQLLGILCQRLVPAKSGGVALLVEYFTNVGATRKFIMEGRLADLHDALGRADDRQGRDFLSSLAQLVRDGKVSEEDAFAVTDNPQELQRMLRGISSSSQATRR